MSDDVNDFLQGGGGVSAKFPTIGTVVKGTVVRSVRGQQTEFGTGKPLFWDDGKPREQVIITLATDEHDASQPDDDGQRNLYVKGQMQKAVGEALKQAGATLEVGGVLAVQYVGDLPSDRGNPAKQYRAQYQVPSAVQGGDLLGGTAHADSQPAMASAAPAAGDLI